MYKGYYNYVIQTLGLLDHCDLGSHSRSLWPLVTLRVYRYLITIKHCDLRLLHIHGQCDLQSPSTVTFDHTRSLWHSISLLPLVTLKVIPRSQWLFGHSEGYWKEKCHVFHYFHYFSRSSQGHGHIFYYFHKAFVIDYSNAKFGSSIVISLWDGT